MQKKISLFLGLVFFIFGILTLPDYGINWDTVNHLPRGQIYLQYLLTGKKDYSELPVYKKYWQKPEELLLDKSQRNLKGPLRSYYQSDAYTFDWYMEIDGTGHPPLSDIISSIFNRVLFGRLKIINDIDSYRVYGVFLASILVGLIYYWVSGLYGKFAGIIAFLSLATYPLFWSESHFNTEKDVPETVYWSLFLYCIWKGFTKKNWKWILASGLLFGLALGTKFNILFSIFVILPWLLIFLKKKIFNKVNLNLIFAGFIAFFIGILIFISSWPFLWQDIISGAQNVFGFYKTIGTSVKFDTQFTGPFGINTYPFYWIIYTTPVLILVLSFFGLISLWVDRKKDQFSTGLLFVLWFMVPIVRVMIPHSNVYGGIRQVMEYIPAMAILAGIGASKIINIIKFTWWKKLSVFSILFSFVLIIFNLVKIHPNENAFFNILIGGLPGAKQRNIPSWGNTFGAAYRQGVVWINQNAEPNSRLAYAHGLMPDIPLIWIRPDIDTSNTYRSGFLRNGEYVIGLVYEGISNSFYFDDYLEKIVQPMYKSGIDGVTLVGVWKNGDEQIKPEYKKLNIIKNISWEKSDKNGETIVDLNEIYTLSHLKMSYSEKGCDLLKNGVIYLSSDNKLWIELRDKLPMDEIPPLKAIQPSKGQFYYPFVAEKARYIKISADPITSCLTNKVTSVGVYSLGY